MELTADGEQSNITEKARTQEAKGLTVEDQCLDTGRLDDKCDPLIMNVVPLAESPYGLTSLQLLAFDGCPEMYCKFMKQYENGIKSEMLGPRQQLLHLTLISTMSKGGCRWTICVGVCPGVWLGEEITKGLLSTALKTRLKSD